VLLKINFRYTAGTSKVAAVYFTVKVLIMNFKNIVNMFGVLAFIGFIAIFLVMDFYPEIPRTGFGWLALFLLGLPAWLFLDWLGALVLGSDFFKKRSSSFRIVVGVPTVILLSGIAFVVVVFVNNFVGHVGG